MSYDDPILCEYFNVSIKCDIALHNEINHFMVIQPEFNRYQVLRTMLAEGTFEVSSNVGVPLSFRSLCEEKEALWLKLHGIMYQHLRGIEILRGTE